MLTGDFLKKKKKYYLQKKKINTYGAVRAKLVCSRHITRHCLISTRQPNKTRECKKMGVCNSLPQKRMYNRNTKKCKYEAIVSCAAVVCRLMLG